jgi:hypothetical protein
MQTLQKGLQMYERFKTYQKNIYFFSTFYPFAIDNDF